MARILMIEQVAEMVAFYGKLLAPHEVVGAETLAQGLRILDADPGSFDLVLTDWATRGPVSEAALFEWAREHRPGLSVVFHTAHEGERPRRLAATMGAFAYLMKWEATEVIRECVASALARGAPDSPSSASQRPERGETP